VDYPTSSFREEWLGTPWAGLLASGSSLYRTFPTLAGQWFLREAPRLQWRDRTGFAPVSLLRFKTTQSSQHAKQL